MLPVPELQHFCLPTSQMLWSVYFNSVACRDSLNDDHERKVSFNKQVPRQQSLAKFSSCQVANAAACQRVTQRTCFPVDHTSALPSSAGAGPTESVPAARL